MHTGDPAQLTNNWPMAIYAASAAVCTAVMQLVQG